MVKNHKLAKQISDVGWGNFLTMLEYKGDIYGCEICYVDRFFPSSKRCSNCGYIKQDLPLALREIAYCLFPTSTIMTFSASPKVRLGAETFV